MTSVTKGRNVSICEKFLRKDEFNELSEFIYETLKECMNSQIFIECSIVETLVKNDLLYRKNYMKYFHYGNNDDMFSGEQTFDFVGSKGTIFLVDNSKGYMQVSYFNREDIEYTHYMQGMQQIVFIYEDEAIVTHTIPDKDIKE